MEQNFGVTEEELDNEEFIIGFQVISSGNTDTIISKLHNLMLLGEQCGVNGLCAVGNKGFDFDVCWGDWEDQLGIILDKLKEIDPDIKIVREN